MVTFTQYLVRRGYALDRGALPLLKRMFLECWAEPGFHRFWRVWNPVYGYVLFGLYRALGGNKHRVPATLLTFACCGFFLHDLPVAFVVGRPLVSTTSAFLAFGAFALMNQRLVPRIKQKAWRRRANVLLNVTLVVCGLLLGVAVDYQARRLLSSAGLSHAASAAGHGSRRTPASR